MGGVIHVASHRRGRLLACRQLESGYCTFMISAIFDAILMVLGLILDIITLPFRLVAALLGGAEFEFQRFSRRRSR